MARIALGLGLAVFAGAFFFRLQGTRDQFRFWQRGDDIAVVAIAPAGGCAFADMKFVGVQLWIGRVDGENVDMFCKQLYDLAMLAHKPLAADEMTEFVARSNEIMMLLAK